LSFLNFIFLSLKVNKVLANNTRSWCWQNPRDAFRGQSRSHGVH